jgi:dolichol-phosphate mannosyltransferase
MKAVIITPTYNERENILSMLTALAGISKQISDYTFSILVVDDNSPDGTREVVKQFQKTHKNVFLLSGVKQGLGAALLRGMSYAIDTLDADVIVQIDADMSHDPKAIPEFFKKLNTGADFVVGSRYIPGGSIPQNWGIHRKIYSIIGNSIVRYGLGIPNIRDWTGGYRVFYKKYFELAKPELSLYSGYLFQIAFLRNAVKHGAIVGEVPIHFIDRRFGHSKIAPLSYIISIYSYIFKARLTEVIQTQFFKFGIVGFIGFCINTVILESLVSYGYNPTIGSAIGAEFAIISNFFLNNIWTFSHKKISGFTMIPKLVQFNTTSLGALLIQSGTVWVGTTLFGHVVYFISYLAGVGFGLIWNYTMYSKVIWKNK